MSVKGTLITDRGERQRLSARLAPRERRRWFAKLLAAQEAIETAQEDMTKLMIKAYNEGLSFDNIAGAVGSHSTTIRDHLLRYVAQNSEDQADA